MDSIPSKNENTKEKTVHSNNRRQDKYIFVVVIVVKFFHGRANHL